MGNRIGWLTCPDDRESSPPRALSSTIRTELGGVPNCASKAPDRARLCPAPPALRSRPHSPRSRLVRRRADSVPQSSRPSATGPAPSASDIVGTIRRKYLDRCSSSADALSKRSLRVVRRALHIIRSLRQYSPHHGHNGSAVAGEKYGRVISSDTGWNSTESCKPSCSSSGSQPTTALSIQTSSSKWTTAGAYGTRNPGLGGCHTTVQL